MQVLRSFFYKKELQPPPPLFFSKVPVSLIFEICRYLPCQSIACLSATQKGIQKEIDRFVLKQWQEIDVNCSTQNLINLSKEYFSQLIREVATIDRPNVLGSPTCRHEEIATIFFSSITNLVETYLLYEEKRSASEELSNMELEIHSPLKMLHVLERVREKLISRNVFVLITKAGNLFTRPEYGLPSFSEIKIFKLIETWNLRKTLNIDVEKREAIGKVLGVSNIEDIDLNIFTILLQNDAFQKISSYPSQFVGCIIEKIQQPCTDHKKIKKIFDLFCEYGIHLDQSKVFFTPIQVAGVELQKKIDHLYAAEQEGRSIDPLERKRILSQIQMTVIIIKSLIEKGVSTQQVINFEGKEEAEIKTLLQVVQEALFVLKGEELPQIIEDLKELVRLCTPAIVELQGIDELTI